MARFISIAEGAERYAGRGIHDCPVYCTRAELDGPVIDLARLPACTPQEYAQPGCPVAPLDEHRPMRWVRGIDLGTLQPTWIPAVMVCYGLGRLSAICRYQLRFT
jgi:ribosomal protein S12 methylthiotransferase accessory factor